MKRVTNIFHNQKYQEHLQWLSELERERKFCRHTVEHFLAVARISYIRAMEEQLTVEKELLYAAALLHDIGKGLQYTEGIPHEEASASIAKEILWEEGFSEDETAFIERLILTHRRPAENSTALERIFYEADKASRECFCCPFSEQCNWKEEIKNKQIFI